MSYSDEKTEAELHNLEVKLSKEYRKAYKDMALKAEQYFKTLEDRYEAEYKKFLAGAYTETEFKNWYATQLARGERWNKVKEDMANRMVEANKVASAYVNDKTPSIYSLNQNYTAWEIYQDTGMIDFTLFDENTVKNLLMENGNYTEFKTLKVNAKRDYEWNSKQIERALSAGIIQGKGIGEIADSFMMVMQRNKNGAIRNARTAFTSAQNAGRLDSMKQAKNRGIDTQKQWLATMDSRTRDSHLHLDGEVKDLDKEFSNGLLFPADPNGEPSEVYNCRCTLLYVHSKYTQNSTNFKEFRDWAYNVKTNTLQNMIKDEMPNYMFLFDANSKLTPKSTYETTVAISKALDKMPLKVKQQLGDVTFMYGAVGSKCDIANKVIYLREGCDEWSVFHEYGHLIENYMMKPKTVNDLKEYLTDGLTITDVYQSFEYTKNGIDIEPVFFLKSNKFDTEYQTRLYINDINEALGDNGKIDTSKMLEIISEPFAKYMTGGNINPMVMSVIERAVK